MRRWIAVIGIAVSLFVFDMQDAFSRGGRGGGGRGGGVGRGGSRGGSMGRTGRTGRNARNSQNKSAKQLEELARTEARMAEIEAQRAELNNAARVEVQEAYAFRLRLDASAGLSK